MTTTLLAPPAPSCPDAARALKHHTVSQTWRWRGARLIKVRRNPEQLFDVTLQPIIFTLMFAYIFGGAIAGDVASYLPILIPGILVQSVTRPRHGHRHPAARGHGQGRLRPVPLPAHRAHRAAVRALLADTMRYAIATTITFAVGFLMGYHPAGGLAGRC